MLKRFPWSPRRESFEHENRLLKRRKFNPRLRQRRFVFERLEFRRVLASVTWDGGGGSFNWNAVHNWNTDPVPGAADAAIITEVNLSSGTLKGTGVFPASLHQSGGQLAPGNSPGCLTIDGDYVLDAGALQTEVEGPVVCTQYDQLRVNGTVTLAGSLDLVLAAAYTPEVNTQFVIIDNDGSDAVIGEFLGLPERQVFLANSEHLFQISYRGGTGNDVVLAYLGTGTIVTSTASSGPGSLIDAIDQATLSGRSIVAFSIPEAQSSSATYLIDFAADNLPVINATLSIDATTQREYAGVPVVQLISAGTTGFSIAADDTQIKGLSMTGWSPAINVVAQRVVIAQNYIGLEPDGQLPDFFRNQIGIRVDPLGSNLTIDRNVISGNEIDGIRIENSGGHTITGNLIGTDPTGRESRPNRDIGLHIVMAGNTTGSQIGGSDVSQGNLMTAPSPRHAEQRHADHC